MQIVMQYFTFTQNMPKRSIKSFYLLSLLEFCKIAHQLIGTNTTSMLERFII